MANDVTVTVSMSVKRVQLETLLSMIPDLEKETIGRPRVVPTRALRQMSRRSSCF
jgi:hypothetical protein